MRMLITSGGCKVPIDSVRHIGNMSSGTFGAKIGYEALKAGHHVTFLMADGSKSPLGLRFTESDGIWYMIKALFFNILMRIKYGRRLRIVKYSTFDQYQEKLLTLALENTHRAIVLAAAISDFGVMDVIDGKIRSTGDMNIRLFPLPKVISKIRGYAAGDAILVGFKLLVGSTIQELMSAACDSIKKNGCDLVIANDLRDIKASNHTVLIVRRNYTATYHSDPKDPNSLARQVVKEIVRGA